MRLQNNEGFLIKELDPVDVPFSPFQIFFTDNLIIAFSSYHSGIMSG